MDVETVRKLAVQALLDARQRNFTGAAITDETPLGDAGLGVNSLTLMRALMKIEDRLNITLVDAVVAGAKFKTVGEIVELVCRVAGATTATSAAQELQKNY
jgi:acyl carrier protein